MQMIADMQMQICMLAHMHINADTHLRQLTCASMALRKSAYPYARASVDAFKQECTCVYLILHM